MGGEYTDLDIKYWSMTYYSTIVASVFSKSETDLVLDDFSYSRRALSQPGMVPVITIELKSVTPFVPHSFVSGPRASQNNFICFLDGVLYELTYTYQSCRYYKKFLPPPVRWKGTVLNSDWILSEMAIPRAIEIFNEVIGL